MSPSAAEALAAVGLPADLIDAAEGRSDGTTTCGRSPSDALEPVGLDVGVPVVTDRRRRRRRVPCCPRSPRRRRGRPPRRRAHARHAARLHPVRTPTGGRAAGRLSQSHDPPWRVAGSRHAPLGRGDGPAGDVGHRVRGRAPEDVQGHDMGRPAGRRAGRRSGRHGERRWRRRHRGAGAVPGRADARLPPDGLAAAPGLRRHRADTGGQPVRPRRRARRASSEACGRAAPAPSRRRTRPSRGSPSSPASRLAPAGAS